MSEPSASSLELLRAGWHLLSTCCLQQDRQALSMVAQGRTEQQNPPGLLKLSQNFAFSTLSRSKKIASFNQRGNRFHLYMGKQYIQG